MSHIAIFIFIVAIILGLAGINRCRSFAVNQDNSCIRTISAFILFFNLFLLLNLITLYISVNLSDRIDRQKLTFIWIVLSWINLFITFGLTYYYYRLILQFHEVDAILWIKHVYKSLFILFAICYLIAQFAFSAGRDTSLFSIMVPLSKYVLFSISLLISIWSLLQSSRTTDRKKRSAMSGFGILFIAGFTVLIIITATNFKPVILFVSLTGLFINLVILLGIRQFLESFFKIVPQSGNFTVAIEDISLLYNISIREKEVLELIMKGKSNKEIEQVLSISPHTVKNHVYSIFRKVGVYSRGQLVSKILVSR